MTRSRTRRRLLAALTAAAVSSLPAVTTPAHAAPLTAQASTPITALASAPLVTQASKPLAAPGSAPLTAPGSAPVAAPGSAAVAAPAQAVKAATVPCPKPKVKPPPGRPPRPVPPPDDPVLRAVGGDALATSGLIIPAGAPKPPALTATSWLVADLDTGEVLGGCGPHVYGTPASVQKMLLAATVMEQLDPKTVVTVTDGDLKIEPYSSAVGLLKGGKYTISTLWLGLLLNSGNEAANALARMGGGGGPDGQAKTVAAMNAQAQALGAYQTHAETPSGLDGPGQFTSAYDLALIARKCFSIPAFGKYALTKTTQIPAQKHLKKGGFQIQNENKLIFKYRGALGGKTGFTKLARHSYIGGAERNGRRLVATVLGAEASPLRGWQQGAALLDWGFSLPKDASVGKLVTPATASAAPSAPATSSAPAASAAPATPAAARREGPRVPLIAAAVIAVVLAAIPLLLLLTQRRRRRIPRPPRTEVSPP